jgi:hypothetical protein
MAKGFFEYPTAYWRQTEMIRGGSGAATTPCTSQARFSRLVTSTKYLAGSTSSCQRFYALQGRAERWDKYQENCSRHRMTVAQRAGLIPGVTGCR